MLNISYFRAACSTIHQEINILRRAKLKRTIQIIIFRPKCLVSSNNSNIWVNPSRILPQKAVREFNAEVIALKYKEERDKDKFSKQEEGKFCFLNVSATVCTLLLWTLMIIPAKILETERGFYPAVINVLSVRNGSETSNFNVKGFFLILFFIRRSWKARKKTTRMEVDCTKVMLDMAWGPTRGEFSDKQNNK